MKNKNSKEQINILLYLTGKIVSLLGTHIYTFAISLYILRTTGSGTSFALSILLSMIPRIILSPIAGSIADKKDRKKIVVSLDVLSGIIVLGLVAISSIYGLKLVFIYITTFLLSVVNTFFDVTIGAAIPNLVSDEKLVKINSYTQVSTSLAGIMGPVLGGVAYGLIPLKLFLIINGISFILSAISEFFINFKYNIRGDTNEDKEIVVEKGFKALTKEVSEGLQFIKNKKSIYSIMKFALILNFLINSTTAVINPFIINDILKLSSTQFGIIQGSFSVGILITSIIIGNLPEREKKFKTLVFGTFIMGLMIILMGIPSIGVLKNLNKQIYFIYYILIMVIFSIVMILVNIPINVSIQRMTPDRMMGRVKGTMESLGGAMTPISVIISGVLLDLIKPYIIPILSGSLIIILSIIMSKNKNLKDF
ncbi:MFS transporter [Senegalia massiliensis]|uniref:MFS transporter n=1 Tax=Senegalia massiliensis TaxID=1720316 RepID=UPI0010314F5E|nr:MFS transporter [Senegalia massiliensis]